MGYERKLPWTSFEQKSPQKTISITQKRPPIFSPFAHLQKNLESISFILEKSFLTFSVDYLTRQNWQTRGFKWLFRTLYLSMRTLAFSISDFLCSFFLLLKSRFYLVRPEPQSEKSLKELKEFSSNTEIIRRFGYLAVFFLI